ncbi:MAG: LysR family transcriptional regulator [Chloroflexi bacterium]|nr:LysR family transcriptional regulator [Chloroflexota bacterium]MBP8054710.1 LysR family transcriptional regulator [Chloroflexota bacterium]
MSIWRAGLLRAIEETGSINAAAAHLNIHYRTAWEKIHEMEKHLGQKLVVTHTGGKKGGGATLTPIALDYLDKFDRFRADVEMYIGSQYQMVFRPVETPLAPPQ